MESIQDSILAFRSRVLYHRDTKYPLGRSNIGPIDLHYTLDIGDT